MNIDRKLVTVRIVAEIRPIENADAIELAIVDGWHCVVKKGDFAAGDKAVYCEIDSLLPVRPEFEFLRQSSYCKQVDGTEGFRLKTIRLRGQISQGLLIPLSILGTGKGVFFPVGEGGCVKLTSPCDLPVGYTLTSELGVTKWEPFIPVSLRGEMKGKFPAFIPKTDEERIQNIGIPTGLFHVTEKLDGTSVTIFKHNEEIGVCSRNWELRDKEGNVYWSTTHANDLAEKLSDYPTNIAIQGEICGPGIQGNPYKLPRATLFVFNIYNIDSCGYYDITDMRMLCESLGLNTVPYLGEIHLSDLTTKVELLTYAEGDSALRQGVEREGVVFHQFDSSMPNARLSFKAISNRFLLKKKD